MHFWLADGFPSFGDSGSFHFVTPLLPEPRHLSLAVMVGKGPGKASLPVRPWQDLVLWLHQSARESGKYVRFCAQKKMRLDDGP